MPWFYYSRETLDDGTQHISLSGYLVSVIFYVVMGTTISFIYHALRRVWTTPRR